jgi:hypothetical protein
MIAALLIIAILDIGPLVGIGAIIQIGYLATGLCLGDDGAHHLIAAAARDGAGDPSRVFGGSIHHGQLGRRDGSVPIDRNG